MANTGVMFAFFPPEEVAQQLINAAQTAGLQDIPALEDMHLTLAYLGEMDQVEGLKQQVTDAAEWFCSYNARPVEAMVSGIGKFNADETTQKCPVYASVDGAVLAGFRESLLYELSYQNVPVMTNHGFTPHITLGYLDEAAAMPDLVVPSLDLMFSELVLAFGDERTTYTFTRKTMVKAMNTSTAPVREFQIVETPQPNSKRVLVEMVGVSELRGEYPKIPLPADVKLKALDTDPDPVFVTLPVGQFDSKSRNNRTYTEAAMRMMYQQIIDRRPEGRWGHLDDWEMGTKYEPPGVRWLNAMIDSEGIIWARCRALTPESENYYRRAMLDNAKVGTSLFAYAEMEGENVISLDLISIDIAEPARVGVPMTAARPLVSSELAGSSPAQNETTGTDVPQEAADEALPEATPTGSPDAQQAVADGSAAEETNEPRGGVVEENSQERGASVGDIQTTPVVTAEQITALETQIAALKSKVTAIADLFGVSVDGDVAAAAKAVIEGRAALQTENAALLQETMAAMIASRIKVVSARQVVQDLVSARKPTTRAELVTAFDAVMAQEHVKDMLKGALIVEMGGAMTLANDEGNNPGVKKEPATPPGYEKIPY